MFLILTELNLGSDLSGGSAGTVLQELCQEGLSGGSAGEKGADSWSWDRLDSGVEAELVGWRDQRK